MTSVKGNWRWRDRAITYLSDKPGIAKYLGGEFGKNLKLIHILNHSNDLNVIFKAIYELIISGTTKGKSYATIAIYRADLKRIRPLLEKEIDRISGIVIARAQAIDELMEQRGTLSQKMEALDNDPAVNAAIEKAGVGQSKIGNHFGMIEFMFWLYLGHIGIISKGLFDAIGTGRPAKEIIDFFERVEKLKDREKYRSVPTAIEKVKDLNAITDLFEWINERWPKGALSVHDRHDYSKWNSPFVLCHAINEFYDKGYRGTEITERIKAEIIKHGPLGFAMRSSINWGNGGSKLKSV